jgi:hypothetical protein
VGAGGDPEQFTRAIGLTAKLVVGEPDLPGAGRVPLSIWELLAATPEAFRALWRILGAPTSPFVRVVTFRGPPGGTPRESEVAALPDGPRSVIVTTRSLPLRRLVTRTFVPKRKSDARR